MNVSIFNKFNHKSTVLDAMYSEWSSLPLEGGGQGVLASIGGKDVVLAVVKQLESSEPSPLTTDTEVEWVVEVLRYGLCLPLKEHEAVRGCVRVCCAWLSPLLGEDISTSPPPPAVPAPVKNNPKHYAKKILLHLHNLFVPRPDEGGDLISKQAVLCHRVLRLARSLAGGSNLSASEWRALLVLLLSAAGSLLSPPAPHHPAADQLCERVLCVLFEVWILACHRCFPTPPLWRTLREQCLRWRHRPALTDQWARVSLCLTARMLTHMYGPDFPAVPVSEEDQSLIPPDMSPEAVMQSWYRILQTIGNPVDMCRPHLISDTPDFLQYSITQEDGVQEPSQHPCLQALPSIFYRAMKGVAAHVDGFLGRGQYGWWTEGRAESTPPPLRRPTASFSITSRQKDKHAEKGVSRSSIIGLTGRQMNVVPPTPPNSIASQASESEKPPLASLRPKVNSLFHLFGEWLFEAALIGTGTGVNQSQRVEGTPPPPSIEAQRTNLVLYQQGRAEALGALCRMLCSKRSGEEVLSPYLARSYAAIHRGVRHSATAAAVVLNAQDIFRLDLDGVLVLVPDFLSALEKILPEKEPKLECGNIDKKELRKAAINVLLSMIAFPNQYKNLPVPEFPGSNEYAGMTISSLTRGRLALVCVSGLQVEWQDALAVPLLSALYLTVLHNAHITSKQSHYSDTTTDHKTRSESGDSLDESNADALLRDLDPASPVFGAALVVRATYLVCHRLISSWKSDLQVSLAALDLLSGLAKLHATRPDGMYSKRAVRWICDYITLQCGRPPQAHSRDLHSCVVAAFLCLQHWLTPKLLADKECFETLIEVVELGISGSKSQGKAGDPIKLKDEKELKPVSMRVRDAAESLLMLIMEMSDTNLQGFTRCRLDERWLSELGHSKMRHFVVDDSIILSLLEEPLANSQEPQPTIIVLVRSGVGRAGWCVLTRGMPRSAACVSRSHTRTTSLHSGPTYPHVPITMPELDSSFPSLDSVLHQLNDSNAPTLMKLLEQQAGIEKKIRDSQRNYTPEECIPPQPVTEFQTARLFLSNFGYLNIGGDKKEPRSIIALDSSKPSFYKALRNLDSCPVRTPITVHCFYVRAKQTNAQNILRNAHDKQLPEPYISMLKGLGKAVRVTGHAGWSGHVQTSFDAKTHSDDNEEYETTPSVYDARRQVLYWSDAISEIAFVVPSERSLNFDQEQNDSTSDVDGICMTKCTEKSSVSSWDLSHSSNHSYERSTSESASDKRTTLSDTSRAISLDLDRQTNSVTSSGRKNRDYCSKILVIWLEDYEDRLNIPIDDLVSFCSTGIPFRPSDVRCLFVSLCCRGASLSLPHSSEERLMLSLSLLPHCVRRMAQDIDARRRLSTDLYQPPHVRRRHLIQEIALQYKKDLSEAELIESLFHPPI